MMDESSQRIRAGAAGTDSVVGRLRAALQLILSVRFWSAIFGLLLIVAVTRELRRDKLEMAAFTVPPALVNAGYSGQELANRTAADLKRIEQITHSIADADQVTLDEDLSIPDAEIPGTSIGVKTVVDLVRSVFHIYPIKVGGAVTTDPVGTSKAGATAITMNLVIDRNHTQGEPFEVTGDMSSISEFTSAIALATIRDINPYLYAAYAAHTHRYPEAVRVIESIVLKPGAATRDMCLAYNLWGSILLSQRQYAEAIVKFQKVISLDAHFAPAFNNWGAALERQGLYSDAARQYQSAISASSRFTTAYINSGLLLIKEKKYDDAIQACSQAIGKRTGDTRAYDCWAAALAAKGGDPEAAVEKYKVALSLNPADPAALRGWGDLLIKMNRTDEALARYQDAVDADPGDPGIYLAYGDVLRGLTRYEDAEVQYDTAISKDASYVGAYNDLGIDLAAQRKFDQAAAMYDKALKLDPRYGRAYDNWGETLEQQGNRTAAIEDFRKAIEYEPLLEDAYLNLERLLDLEGKSQESAQVKQQWQAAQAKYH